MSETTETLGLKQNPENDMNTVPFNIPDGYKMLSDQDMKKLAEHIVEDSRDKWEIQEIADNAVATGATDKLLRNEFMYEFKQGDSGRIVRGLTSSMISHLATASGISEVIEQRRYEKTEETHEFDVVVSMKNPLDPHDKLYRSGFSEEPIVLYGKRDRFAKQKAHTKAFRNACMKLLPQDLIISTIFKLAKLMPTDWTPDSQVPATVGAKQNALPAPVSDTVPIPQTPADMKPVPEADKQADAKAAAKLAEPERIHSVEEMEAETAPEGNDKTGYYRRYGFALWNEHQPLPNGTGRLPADFWERVKAKYGVSSRQTMTLVHWQDCLTFIDDLLNGSETEAEGDKQAEGMREARDSEIE